MEAQFAIGVAVTGMPFGIAISSLEYLWLGYRGAFDNGGFWPWPLMATDYYAAKTKLLSMFDHRSTIFLVLWSRTVVAVAGVVFIAMGLSPLAPLLILIVLNGILHYQIRWGGEGGDHMTSLILLCSTISYAASSKPITLASCCFLGAQLMLAYFASGLAKLTGRVWRSGAAFTEILSNYSYGNRFLASLGRRYPSLSATFCYAVIAVEVAFPLYLVLDAPYCYCYLLIGFLFHIGVAVIMRLHLFLYTFVALYPCLIVTRDALRSAVSL